jgi:hypothetical protein
MAHHPHPDHRPSDRTPPPDDVTDRLLWALAVDVAAAHQPGPGGACTNLQCGGQQGPCWALRTAHRAEQRARRTPTLTAPTPRRAATARGRAPVPAPPRRFTGWFTPTRPPAHLVRPEPAPDTAPPHPRFHRRPPVAALAA